MITSQAPAEIGSSRRRRRALVVGMALLSVVALGAGQLSLALFTDQETVDATFGSGTIDLDGTKIDALTLSVASIMPGDSVTDDVVVDNVGTAVLRYAMTTSSTNADAKGLRDVLTLTVKTLDATTPLTPCDDFDGTSVLAATALGASAARFGDATPGEDSGDRTLAVGADETLCFRISLPLLTGAAYAGASTTTTFTFDAEQTSNNP